MPEFQKTAANRVMGCTTQVCARDESAMLHPADHPSAYSAASAEAALSARPLTYTKHMLVQVWLSAELDAAGNVQLSADSDAVLSRGFAAVVVAALSGMRPDALLAANLTAAFGELGLDAASLTPSRTNGFLNLLEAVRKRVRMLTTALPSFPSLLIKRDGITAQVRRALSSRVLVMTAVLCRSCLQQVNNPFASSSTC